MASTITVQSVLDWARTFPRLTAALGNPVAGYSLEPTMSIANTIMQEVLSAPFNWKWNRALAAPFVTNSLQQDYSTSITDLAWLESCTLVDINSMANPKLIRGIDAVRELLPTSVQGIPAEISWVANDDAICGQWVANTKFVNNAGVPSGQMVKQPLTQIRDLNGNIQAVTTFGTTGSVQPTWATTPGQTTVDGTAIWMCVDPMGITFRLSPAPPITGQLWQVCPVYQRKPPLITAFSQTFSPIPDELSYVFREGFLAYAMRAADDPRADRQFLLYQAKIQQALGGSDREREEFSFVPCDSIFGGQRYVDGGWPLW